MKYKIPTYLLCVLIFLSCEEVVDPELISEGPVFVIEGVVSTREGESQVVISQTAAYNSQVPNPRISGAEVTIADNEGRQYMFLESLEAGKYIPSNQGFTGWPGRRYSLQVRVGDRLFTANSRLVEAPVLDSITYMRRVEDPFFEDGYYLRMHFQEPPGIRNFYLWEAHLGNNPLTEDQINIFSDEDFNGQYLNFEIPEPIEVGDAELPAYLKVDFYSLNKDSYNYFRGLSLLTEVGSPSQAVPENPPSNIEGGALGFFNTTDVSFAEVMLQDGQ